MKRCRSGVFGIVACVVLLLTLGVLVAACGGSDEPASTETTGAGTTVTTGPGGTESTTTTAGGGGAQPELKVGALLMLDSVQGVEMKKWLDLFAKLYNDAGGWEIGGVKYKVVPKIYDTGAMDPAASRAAAEKAILQDGVKYMVCNWGDVPASTITITEPNKVLWLGLDFTDETIKPELKYAIRAQGLFFAQALFYYIVDDYMAKGAKSVLVVVPDSQQGQVGAQLVASTAQVAGMEVKPPILFGTDVADFGPIATKIMAANPDAVFMSYVGGEQVINICGALKDAGYKGLVLPGNLEPTSLEGLVKRCGKEYIEGWESGYFDPDGIETDPQTAKLIEAYKAEYGEWHQEGCFWIGPWFFFEDAVNATQSLDVETLAAYLKDSKKGVKTLNGYSQLFARPDAGNFATVDAAPGHYVGIVQDGKFVYHATLACKDQYLVSIKCYGLKDVYQQYWDKYGKPTFPDQPSRYDFADLDK